MVYSRGGKFGIQIEPDWPQMGQICDFLSSVSVHFGARRQNVLKLILKRPRFVQFGGQSDPFWIPNLTSMVYSIIWMLTHLSFGTVYVALQSLILSLILRRVSCYAEMYSYTIPQIELYSKSKWKSILGLSRQVLDLRQKPCINDIQAGRAGRKKCRISQI